MIEANATFPHYKCRSLALTIVGLYIDEPVTKRPAWLVDDADEWPGLIASMRPANAWKVVVFVGGKLSSFAFGSVGATWVLQIALEHDQEAKCAAASAMYVRGHMHTCVQVAGFLSSRFRAVNWWYQRDAASTLLVPSAFMDQVQQQPGPRGQSSSMHRP